MSGIARRLRALAGAAPAHEPARWVVVDVESSGLDPRRDRLLAIAAIAVHVDAAAAAPRIAPGDSFEVVLRHDDAPADKPNILLHGIGVGAQREGVPAPQALRSFEQWRAGAPLLAFHAAFDQTLITRALRAAHGRRPVGEWVDLEQVAGVACPDVAARTLDEWIAHFGIRCARRHQAAADALATAELLLKLWPAIRRQVARPDFGALQRLASQRRWLK